MNAKVHGLCMCVCVYKEKHKNQEKQKTKLPRASGNIKNGGISSLDQEVWLRTQRSIY
jgi:hypothetical protein